MFSLILGSLPNLVSCLSSSKIVSSLVCLYFLDYSLFLPSLFFLHTFIIRLHFHAVYQVGQFFCDIIMFGHLSYVADP